MDTRYNLQFKATQNGQLLRNAISNQGISKKALTSIKFNGGTILVNGIEKMYAMF